LADKEATSSAATSSSTDPRVPRRVRSSRCGQTAADTLTALGLNVVGVAALEDVVTLSLLRENCIYSSGLGRR